MVSHGMTRLQQLFQQQLVPQYHLDRSKETANAATTTDSEGPAPRTERRKKGKERRHSCRYPSPSTFQSPLPTVQRKRTTLRRSHSRTNRARDNTKEKKNNPKGYKYLRKYGRNGLANGPSNNILHSKCKYNKKCKGWSPDWVCRKIGVDFKEYNHRSK